MSDWQVGDLAVCVDAVSRDGSGDASAVLREGVSYRVTAVCGPHYWEDGTREHGLRLAGHPHPGNFYDWSWPACRFRKVRPDEHEACEPEFVTLLQGVRHKRIKEHVAFINDFYGSGRAA